MNFPGSGQVARWALPVALAVLMVAGTLGANDNHRGANSVLAIALAVAAGLAVPAALVRPRTALILAGVAVGAWFGRGLSNGPIFLAVPLVAFAAAQRIRPPPLLLVLVPALGMVVTGLAVRSAVYGADALVTSWQAIGLCTLSVSAATIGWARIDRRAGRQARAERTATEERLRMAQDLHDGVGHGLAVITMHAGVALHLLDKEQALNQAKVLDQVRDPGEDARSAGEHRPERGPRLAREQALGQDNGGPGKDGGPGEDGEPSSGDRAALRQSLQVIRETSRESLDALRAQLAVISGSDAPGPRRPAPGLADLEALLARVRAGGLDVERRGWDGEVPADVGRVAYTVVQEALTNVLRHAVATRAVVTVTLVRQDLVVSIQDDGRPGRPEPAATAGMAGTAPGMGIAGMRERVERLGGVLQTGYGEQGFRVVAIIPVRP